MVVSNVFGLLLYSTCRTKDLYVLQLGRGQNAFKSGLYMLVSSMITVGYIGGSDGEKTLVRFHLCFKKKLYID